MKTTMSPNQVVVLQASYLKIRQQLQQRAPSAWAEVSELCSALPAAVNKNAVWNFGRNKPCFSNIKVDVGARIAADLTLSRDFDSYETIASDAWEITLIKRGINWKSNSNFQISGTRVAAYLNSLQRGGLASYVWRLYAIRLLAIALHMNPVVNALIDKLEAIKQSNCIDLTNWVKAFASEVGTGWGYVTVNHLLTDLGLSIKPDLHVRRAAIRMGLLTPEIPSNLSLAEIDKLSPKIDEQIVVRLKEMSIGIVPAASQNAGSILREIDKTLMEWSRQDLIDLPA